MEISGMDFPGVLALGQDTRPVLIVANHMGWWDGFVLMKVQKKIRPHAPIYTIMLETELRKNPWFWPLGALALHPGSPASLRALLRRLRQIRTQRGPGAWISFFPQGKIVSSARRPLEFREGVLRLARELAPVQLLPVALTSEFGAHPRPTLQARLGKPLEYHKDLTTQELESIVTALIDQSAHPHETSV